MQGWGVYILSNIPLFPHCLDLQSPLSVLSLSAAPSPWTVYCPRAAPPASGLKYIVRVHNWVFTIAARPKRLQFQLLLLNTALLTFELHLHHCARPAPHSSASMVVDLNSAHLYCKTYWHEGRYSWMYSSVTTVRTKASGLIILKRKGLPPVCSTAFTRLLAMDRSSHSRSRPSNNHHPYHHNHHGPGRARGFSPPSNRYHQSAFPPPPHLGGPNPLIAPSDFLPPSHFWYACWWTIFSSIIPRPPLCVSKHILTVSAQPALFCLWEEVAEYGLDTMLDDRMFLS